MSNLKILIWILILLILIGGTVGWAVYQWHLCREAGMSFWYCVQHIG